PARWPRLDRACHDRTRYDRATVTRPRNSSTNRDRRLTMAGASTYVMGPGTLTFGETGSEQEVSCQITTGTVTWDTDQEDDTPVLCGDVEPGAVTFTAALEATLYQDISAEGVVEWSWSNKGSTVPVEFVP